MTVSKLRTAIYPQAKKYRMVGEQNAAIDYFDKRSGKALLLTRWSQMNAVFEVVVPIFGIVILSFALARIGVFSAATSDGLTRFMFYVAVPAMLFRTLAAADLPTAVPWRYVLAFYGPSFIVFACAAWLSKYAFAWRRPEQGIAAITAAYSNMVMLGLPLVVSGFGEAGSVPLFILLAFQSTLIFPVTTWMIEVLGRDPSSPRSSIFHSLAKLILNPVILSLALGITCNLMSIEIGGAGARILDILSAAAPACALVALGAGLAQYEFRGDLNRSLSLAFLKGVAHPGLVWISCWLLDISTLWTQVAVLLAAMPTGINAFIFAQKYKINVSVVSKTIVLSTIFSIFSVSALLHFFL